MKYYIPQHQNDSSEKRPLVIALHGCSQTSKSLASTAGWNKLADENNFLILYPSQKRINNASRCFNWFLLDDISPESGELESIMNMINYSIKHYNIDTTQIYVYGVSAGAAMGVALVSVYPEYFKAGAILAGAPYKIAINKAQGLKAMLKAVDKLPEEWRDLVSLDTTKKYPKLIVCHGTKDKVVNIKNSFELIEQWTSLHQTDTIPDQVIEEYQSPLVFRSSYTNKDEVESVVFYKFKSTGHAIPIDPGKGISQGGKPHVYTKDIGFFSTYYIGKEFGLISE